MLSDHEKLDDDVINYFSRSIGLDASEGITVKVDAKHDERTHESSKKCVFSRCLIIFCS